MKRSLYIFMTILLCVLVVFPMTAYAKTYTVSETDLSIQLDDSEWYVFTRDNIKDNPELVGLGSSYEQMYDILHSNEAYMDALIFHTEDSSEIIIGFTELIIRKTEIDSGIVNLSNYGDDKALELAKGIADKQSATDYSVYKSEYKFARLNYIDSGYHLCEFLTVVNKEGYTFTFQSQTPFTDADYEEFENIIDSIRFDIDTSLKESNNSSFWSNVITKAIGGAVIGGIVGAVISLVNKKKKKNEQNNPISSDITDIGQEE